MGLKSPSRKNGAGSCCIIIHLLLKRALNKSEQPSSTNRTIHGKGIKGQQGLHIQRDKQEYTARPKYTRQQRRSKTQICINSPNDIKILLSFRRLNCLTAGYCDRSTFTFQGGRAHTDKIGVGPGGDIDGTDIARNLYGQAVHGADRTKLSGRPPTCRRDAGDPLDKYAGLVRKAGVHSSSM